MTEKQIKILGIVASIMAVGMYVAYIPQIADNLAGHKGNPVQPFVAFVNCTLWTGYGLFKKTARLADCGGQRTGHLFGFGSLFYRAVNLLTSQ